MLRDTLPRALVALALVSTACHASFRDPRYPAGEEKTHWSHFYFWGTVGHADIDLRDYCSTGHAREVYLSSDILMVGLTIITLGIYIPRKVTITCEKEPAAK